MFGTRSKRKIRHRSILRDEVFVPLCNVHYGGKVDHGRTRTFREAEGAELEFKLCGRCGQQVTAFRG